jgi:anti-sigma B factor antagonist
MFRYEQAERDGVTLLALHGNLDAVTAPGLKDEVVRIAGAHRHKVVVDLSTLTLIDSTGVGVLISLFKRTRADGGHVYFAGLGGQPKEVFRLLRLDRSLDLFASVKDAQDQLLKS